MKQGSKLGEAPTLGMMRQELLELVRREGEISTDIKASLGQIEGRFDGMGTGLCGLERRIDDLSHKIDRFRHNLPRVIRDAVREAIEPLLRKR